MDALKLFLIGVFVILCPPVGIAVLLLWVGINWPKDSNS